VQMNLTKHNPSNDDTELIVRNKKGEDGKNLLDISPSDVVFYVGGYPDGFAVSNKEIRTAIRIFIFSERGVLLKPFSALLLLSCQLLSATATPSTRAALSSSPLTTRSSVSTISKRQRTSMRRFHARGLSERD